MKAAEELSPEVGTKSACEALNIPRASFYRDKNSAEKPEKPRKEAISERALSAQEKQVVLDTLHSERFADKAPYQVYAELLDENIYLCSISTMYRILEEQREVRERRNQLRHPVYKKPELLATAPNQVWSWDITKLKGPVKWTYFYLYVVIDIFSRYVVGWMVASRESAGLAKRFLEETFKKQAISPGQLTVHSDRGPSMKSKPVAFLLADLGVTKSHSRPYVSNDNPFSESHFKTLKYRPEFPERFGCLEDSRSFCRTLFPWYNQEHRHSSLGLMTPEMVHYGHSKAIFKARACVLEMAYRLHPERFVNKKPRPPKVPTAVWINPPKLQGTQGAVPGGTEESTLNSNHKVSQIP